MSENASTEKRPLYLNSDIHDAAYVESVLKALGSTPRLRILELLSDNVYNLSEIAQRLDMSMSTANLHVTVLEQAGLITSKLHPASRGRQKMCARTYDTVILSLAYGKAAEEQDVTYTSPIGAYVNAEVAPTCGLASETGVIGLFDDPRSFYEPDRLHAQLIWFHHGYVEYRFPNRLPAQCSLTNLRLSFELCSEAPLHHDEWPTDITVWINDVEIGEWTCPSDFNSPRGLLTPLWWEDRYTQYGLLKIWQVTDAGSFIEGMQISDVSLNDLNLHQNPLIAVRIGVKPTSAHVGGINLFGRLFGNYPQDIVLRLSYR